MATPSVEIAISLDEVLLAQVEQLARDMQMSPSKVFTLAAEEFLCRRANQQLLRDINAAYGKGPDPDEQVILRRLCQQQRGFAEDTW